MRYGFDDSFEKKTLEEVGKLKWVTREWIRRVLVSIWEILNFRDIKGNDKWLLGETDNIKELQDLISENAEFDFSGEKLSQVHDEISDKFRLQLEQEEKIIADVAKRHNFSVEELLSQTRKKGHIIARQEAIVLLRQNLNLSFPVIANLLKLKDHTTVMHHWKKYCASKSKDETTQT